MKELSGLFSIVDAILIFKGKDWTEKGIINTNHYKFIYNSGITLKL
jgi:hypothetical protein